MITSWLNKLLWALSSPKLYNASRLKEHQFLRAYATVLRAQFTWQTQYVIAYTNNMYFGVQERCTRAEIIIVPRSLQSWHAISHFAFRRAVIYPRSGLGGENNGWCLHHDMHLWSYKISQINFSCKRLKHGHCSRLIDLKMALYDILISLTITQNDSYHYSVEWNGVQLPDWNCSVLYNIPCAAAARRHITVAPSRSFEQIKSQ